MRSMYFMLLIAAFSTFLFSCQEEELLTTETELQEETMILGENQEPQGREINPLLIFDEVSDNSDEGLKAFLAEATEADILRYQNEYAVFDFFKEKGLIHDSNMDSWTNKFPLIEQDLSEFLNEAQKEELSVILDEINVAPFKSNCQSTCGYVLVGYYPWGPYYTYVCGQFSCSSNTVVLYEGNNCTQDRVGIIDVHYDRNINFKNHSCCPNDEARSAEFWNMKKNQIIVLFDDSSPSSTYSDNSDDYIQIVIKKDFTYKKLNSFEDDLDNEFMYVNYCCGGNLDGKVSYFRARNL